MFPLLHIDIMWVVSIGAILEAREKQSLGVLNPLPFVAGKFYFNNIYIYISILHIYLVHHCI